MAYADQFYCFHVLTVYVKAITIIWEECIRTVRFAHQFVDIFEKLDGWMQHTLRHTIIVTGINKLLFPLVNIQRRV